MSDEQKYKDLFEFAFKEIKEDILHLRQDLKELKKDIFGNGKAGMCTQRQEILRKWVEKLIEKEKEIVMKDIKRIQGTPEKIYIWMYRLFLLGGIIANIYFFYVSKLK